MPICSMPEFNSGDKQALGIETTSNLDLWATIVGPRGIGPLLGLGTSPKGDLHLKDF